MILQRTLAGFPGRIAWMQFGIDRLHDHVDDNHVHIFDFLHIIDPGHEGDIRHAGQGPAAVAGDHGGAAAGLTRITYGPGKNF